MLSVLYILCLNIPFNKGECFKGLTPFCSVLRIVSPLLKLTFVQNKNEDVYF